MWTLRRENSLQKEKQRTLFKSKYKIIFINKEMKQKLENKRIYFRTKQTQNRDIKTEDDRTTKKNNTQMSWKMYR